MTLHFPIDQLLQRFGRWALLLLIVFGTATDATADPQKLRDIPFRYFAPDGTIVTHCGGCLLFYDDQGERDVLSDDPHQIGAVAFSLDGKWLAHARLGEKASEVVLRDFSTRKVTRILSGAQGGTVALCFSPDNRKLCATTRSTLTVVWDLSND